MLSSPFLSVAYFSAIQHDYVHSSISQTTQLKVKQTNEQDFLKTLWIFFVRHNILNKHWCFLFSKIFITNLKCYCSFIISFLIKPFGECTSLQLIFSYSWLVSKYWSSMSQATFLLSNQWLKFWSTAEGDSSCKDLSLHTNIFKIKFIGGCCFFFFFSLWLKLVN